MLTIQEKINFVVDYITSNVYFKDGKPYMKVIDWDEMTAAISKNPNSKSKRHQAITSLVKNYPTAFNAFSIGYNGVSVTYMGKMIIMDTANR